MIPNTLRIDFEPVGKRVDVEAGTSLLEAASRAGIEIISVCGGMGTCGQCVVQDADRICAPAEAFEQANFTPDELEQGLRLACLAAVQRSGRIHIPPESLSTPQRLQVEGLEGFPMPASAFRVVDIHLEEPGLDDLRSDATRLQDALEPFLKTRPELRVVLLESLSDDLRSLGWNFRTVCRGSQVIAILPPGRKPLGLAADVGTTKIAAYLLDLETGQLLSRSSAMNPQIHYGEDVISRIAYCNENPGGRHELQARVVETLNGLAASMCAEQGENVEHIVEAVAAGNTAMHHLLAGLPVRQLGLSPYVPAVNASLDLLASSTGLMLNPAASLVLPEVIAGYVGADHTTMLLASSAYQAKDTVVAIDIGTNTEVSLVHHGEITCCSCASGPAFEGAHIHEGMRASAGAVEKVQIKPEGVQVHTIGGLPPVGICGSGILDAVAEMLLAGILTGRGGLNPDAAGVRGAGKDAEFVLVPAGKTGTGRDLTVTRRDINEILLAKAAIQTGVELLLQDAGISAEQIDRFIVAGAFGTYLDIHSAVRIGMFPAIPFNRFAQIGNAAGTGARWYLISKEMRIAAAELAIRVKYTELTTHPNFQDTYIAALRFPTPPA